MTRNGSGVSRSAGGPTNSLILARPASRLVASISSIPWMWGICHDACIARAVTRRIPLRGCTPWGIRPRASSPGAAERVAAGVEAPLSTAPLRSASVTRPPGPVPVTVRRSMPASRARRRTAGAAFTRRPPAAGVAGAAGTRLGPSAGSTVATVVAVVAGGADVDVGRAPSTSISMSTSPTLAMSPTAGWSAATVPATGAGNSVWLLSVRISTIGWSRRSTSPGPTSHSTISASSRPSPTSGRRNSNRLMASARWRGLRRPPVPGPGCSGLRAGPPGRGRRSRSPSPPVLPGTRRHARSRGR